MPLVLQISFLSHRHANWPKLVQKGGFIQNGVFSLLAGGCQMVKTKCLFISACRQLC